MQISERVRTMKPSLTLSVNTRAMELRAQGIQVTSLAVGEPDFPTPKHICEAAKAAIDANFCRYTAVPGIPELRAAVGGYFKKFYGEDIAPECTIVSAGGKHALYNFMQASINPGDEVLLPAPYWVSYPYTIQLAGGVPVIVQASLEQGFKVTPEMLDAKCTDKTKLLVLNTPSNPTGAVYNAEELAAILDWADSRDVYVLTDEIYDQLVFAPAKMASAVHHFAKNPEKVAILNGVSKSFAMTGWRVGYACAPKELLAPMFKIHQYTMLCASIQGQVAADRALGRAFETGFEDVRTMVRSYDRRRRLMVESLNDMGLACFEPRGAFYVFPSIKGTGLTSDEFCTRLLEKKQVACVPGTAFGASGEGHIRCSYATSLENLNEALKRIHEFVNEL